MVVWCSGGYLLYISTYCIGVPVYTITHNADLRNHCDVKVEQTKHCVGSEFGEGRWRCMPIVGE